MIIDDAGRRLVPSNSSNSYHPILQVLSKVTTVSIDKCEGTTIILNRDSLDAEIVSAKSSELNIQMPGTTDADEFKEVPIPEQFVSKMVNGKWVTECMAHTA
mmetsp:Transcript_22568/g.61935  ORF Transcript_22568/g.61935 Transcript_22568/m.61935 type:complete len:102 (-) Transcript_22568:529-834(-)|eukprot:scaffold307750_cov37-Tisochrysis_lutea.AAC.2